MISLVAGRLRFCPLSVAVPNTDVMTSWVDDEMLSGPGQRCQIGRYIRPNLATLVLGWNETNLKTKLYKTTKRHNKYNPDTLKTSGLDVFLSLLTLFIIEVFIIDTFIIDVHIEELRKQTFCLMSVKLKAVLNSAVSL